MGRRPVPLVVVQEVELKPVPTERQPPIDPKGVLVESPEEKGKEPDSRRDSVNDGVAAHPTLRASINPFAALMGTRADISNSPDAEARRVGRATTSHAPQARRANSATRALKVSGVPPKVASHEPGLTRSTIAATIEPHSTPSRRPRISSPNAS